LAAEGKVCGLSKIIDEGKGIVVAREQQSKEECPLTLATSDGASKGGRTLACLPSRSAGGQKWGATVFETAATEKISDHSIRR
jgi:hypothetical protein